MSAEKLECSACDNALTFGGASEGFVEAYGGMEVVMEMMAENAGWHLTPGGWLCRGCQ